MKQNDITMDPPNPPSSCSVSPLSTSPYAETADEDNIARLLDAVPQLDSLFNIRCCIGHGTFSSVYLARIKHTTTINGRKHFAIKHIIPTSHPSRVCMELRCLKMIGGLDNVMGVTMCFRQMNHVVLVMPHFPHDPFSEYVSVMGTQELRDYLVNLLHALRRVHSFKVIHRDVKPANFLYNRRQRRYSLVDFGLAQEISDRGRSRGGASQGGGLKASPPITDTPLSTSSTKTVKRKLSVYSAEDGDELGKQPWGKRQCAGILSSSTSRLNTALRRSPRKKCLSHTSPRKENFEIPSQDFPVTPKKAAACDLKLGSPSKHTRSGAEACCRLDTLGSGAQRSLTGALQLRLEVANGLRRSPRKIASSANRKILTPLEGLAKHLHDASSLPSYSAKPMEKEESHVLGRHGVHLPSHASPRVSGLSFNPDVNGVVSKSSKNRTLIEVKSGSGSVLRAVSCHCYGSAKVCSVCLTRSNQVAPRAGTPGFRAPEVLMRHPHQDTGVDMWSVGVVLLSLLSGRYPFFRAVDDLSNLAEITTLLGTAAVRRAAAKMGKLFKCSEEHHPVDLMKVCEFLHGHTATLPQGEPCPGCRQRGLCVCLSPLVSDSPRMPNRKRTHSQKSNIIKNDTTMLTPVQKDMPVDAETSLTCTPDMPESRSVSVNAELTMGITSSSSSSSSSSASQTYPVEAYHLLMRLLDPSPDTRITAAEALGHPFLNPEEERKSVCVN